MNPVPNFRCPRCNGWAFSFRPSTGLHYCNSDANGMHMSMSNEEFEEFTNTGKYPPGAKPCGWKGVLKP